MTDTFGYFGGRLIGGPKFLLVFLRIKLGQESCLVGQGFLCTYFFMEFNAFTDFTLNAQTLFLFAIILSLAHKLVICSKAFEKKM